jgi:translation initiation factor IF-2
VPKEIDIMEVITVSELAKKMNLKASELISKLMSMGMMVTINQQIDAETAQILADEYGCKVNIVSLYDETVIETSEDKEEDLQARPPVVTVMGHVDHGKTKLLDAIRTTDVASGEFGGITQHIGAYQVKLPDGSHLTFVDTPGHSAFTMMRARGAQVTDIVILVVAADDGVMPQTKEAVSHAREAGVPIIVAINKTDLPGANPDRVKQELSELDLVPEEWGGNTLYTSISALKHEGIDSLLENLKLQAEVLELKANYNCEAEGRVIESKVDPGRGTVSTVLVQRGTLKIGDNFVAGVYPGRVRNMFNDKGERLEEAPPSTPVEILGLTGLPDAGDPFQVTENERTARQVGDKRQELKKVEEAQNVRKITLDNLYESIQEGEVQELKVIIKGDVQGSVEALEDALEKLSTSEVRLHPIQATAGAVNENDVRLASASNAIIIAFHVRATPRAQEMAEREKVEIRKYNVIYEVVDDIKSAMEGLLEPERHEEVVGTAEVRDVFKVPKIGLIAGCYVTSGKVRRNALVHVIRDDIEVYSGKISSLKRFKEDAREVEAGYECGIGVQNYNDVKVGDRLEIYEVREVERTLEQTEQHQQ